MPTPTYGCRLHVCMQYLSRVYSPKQTHMARTNTYTHMHTHTTLLRLATCDLIIPCSRHRNHTSEWCVRVCVCSFCVHWSARVCYLFCVQCHVVICPICAHVFHCLDVDDNGRRSSVNRLMTHTVVSLAVGTSTFLPLSTFVVDFLSNQMHRRKYTHTRGHAHRQRTTIIGVADMRKYTPVLLLFYGLVSCIFLSRWQFTRRFNARHWTKRKQYKLSTVSSCEFYGDDRTQTERVHIHLIYKYNKNTRFT